MNCNQVIEDFLTFIAGGSCPCCGVASAESVSRAEFVDMNMPAPVGVFCPYCERTPMGRSN